MRPIVKKEEKKDSNISKLKGNYVVLEKNFKLGIYLQFIMLMRWDDNEAEQYEVVLSFKVRLFSCENKDNWFIKFV